MFDKMHLILAVWGCYCEDCSAVQKAPGTWEAAGVVTSVDSGVRPSWFQPRLLYSVTAPQTSVLPSVKWGWKKPLSHVFARKIEQELLYKITGM